MKYCKKCLKDRPLKDFGRDKNAIDGLSFYCSICKSDLDKESYLKHKEKRKISGKIYRKNNVELIKERKKLDRAKNKDRDSRTQKNYYETNKSERRLKSRNRYYLKKSEINQKIKEKKKNDLIFRLRANLRSRLSVAIRGDQKRGSAIRDLGCSIEFLKNYLEGLFEEGMSWDNYGFGNDKWNIDHKIALASVDLTNKDEFLKVCHYSNLQPLWHLENISKGKKFS